MKLKITSALIFTGLSSQIFAAATLVVPEELVVISVNNQEVKSGLFKSKKQYQIDVNQPLVNVRYNQYFELPLNNHEIVKSDILTLKLPALEDNKSYKLDLIHPPRDLDQAKTFAKNPQLAIYNQNNQLISNNLIVQMTSQSLLGGTINQILHNEPQASPMTKSSSSSINTQTVEQADIKNTNSNTHVGQTLIEVWKNSSKQERQKFMTWLATQ